MWSQHVLRGAIAASILVSSSPALAKDVFPNEFAAGKKSVALQPAAKWTLLKSEESCQLTRRFGEEDNLHVLSIVQSAPGNTFSLTAAGPAFKYYRTGKPISLGMQSDAPMVEFELPPTGEYAGVGRAIILSSVIIADPNTPDADRLGISSPVDSDAPQERVQLSAQLNMDEAAKIERVVFGRRGKAISFETGTLTSAFGALNACTSEKLMNWGLDPQKHQTFTPAKLVNERAVGEFLESRYSHSARVRGEQAIFRVRVNVEKDGRVSECAVNAMTTTDKIVSPACDAMEIATFEPALDAEGNPMRSFYSTTISYRIAG
ncbi:MAG: energy transducer TonB [Pseudomonadota bacterium]